MLANHIKYNIDDLIDCVKFYENKNQSKLAKIDYRMRINFILRIINQDDAEEMKEINNYISKPSRIQQTYSI